MRTPHFLLLAVGFAAIFPLHAQTVTQVWAKRYNGPANLDDFPVAVAADSLGNVVVTGYSTNADLTTDYYTAKYAAADGTLLWEVRYNGPANANDEASSLALDSSGNVAAQANRLATITRPNMGQPMAHYSGRNDITDRPMATTDPTASRWMRPAM